MQQEIREPSADSARPPAGAGAADRRDPYPGAGTQQPQPPQHQRHSPQQPYQQHLHARGPAASGSADAAGRDGDGDAKATLSPLAAGGNDASCLDGTTETRDSGSLADWVMSVATKPRRGNAPSRSHSGSVSASAGGSHQPAQLAPASSWNGGGGGGKAWLQQRQAGGRGGVVTTLAVQAPPEAELAAAAATATAESLPSHELQLAPEDCEPDWLLTSEVPSLAAWTLQLAAQRRAGGGGAAAESAAERGAAMWASLHGSGDSASRKAALRRHNNMVLAEAGMFGGSWSLSAAVPEAVPASVEAEAASVAAPMAMAVPEVGAQQPAVAQQASSHAEAGGIDFADYII